MEEKLHAVPAFRGLVNSYGWYYHKLKPDGIPGRGVLQPGLFDYLVILDGDRAVPIEVEADGLSMPFSKFSPNQRQWYERQRLAGLRGVRFWWFFMLGFPSFEENSDLYPVRAWLVDIPGWLRVESSRASGKIFKSISYIAALQSPILKECELLHIGEDLKKGWVLPVDHPFALEYHVLAGGVNGEEEYPRRSPGR